MHDPLRQVRSGAPRQPRFFVVKSGTDLTEPEFQLICTPAIRRGKGADDAFAAGGHDELYATDEEHRRGYERQLQPNSERVESSFWQGRRFRGMLPPSILL